jgi:hypothetical protein
MEPHEIGNKGDDMRGESSRVYNGCPFASIGILQHYDEEGAVHFWTMGLWK